MLTLNQEIEILKNFTFKHRGLNSYYHEGESVENPTTESPTYPKLESFVESYDCTKDMSTTKFKLIISDLVTKDLRNRDKVLSDLRSVATDFLYYMRQIERDKYFPGFRVQKDIQLLDFNEGDDGEAGWIFDYTITSHIGNYSCSLPINGGNILDNNYIYINGSTTPITSNTMIAQDEFTYDGNPMVLSQIPDIMIASFAGGNVINETDDYAIATKSGHLHFEIGTKIKFTYTYQ
jgi:hypothetical protein